MKGQGIAFASASCVAGVLPRGTRNLDHQDPLFLVDSKAKCCAQRFVWKSNGPENLARLTDGGKVTSMRGKLKRTGQDNNFLLELVSSAVRFPKDAEPGKIQMR